MNTKRKGKLKYIVSLLVIVLALAIFIFSKIQNNNNSYRIISVIDVTGNVSVVKNGIEYTAYKGMHLSEGHEIVTSGNGCVRLVLDGNKYIKLESGSKLTFERLGLLGSGKTSLKLDRGSIISEIVEPLGEEEEFIVSVPNAILAVRGTFFRVDITSNDNGEIVSDVVTYGGAVASKRVLPTGDIIEEEVLVEAGFKTSINMDVEKTVYVVCNIEIEEIIENSVLSEPIIVEDISDDDMVDIYFSLKNGHELFVTEEDVISHIEEREIVIEEYIPIYEMAEVILESEQIKNNKIANGEIYADDSRPIEIITEVDSIEDNQNDLSQTMSGIPITDGVGEEKIKLHKHEYEEIIIREATCTEPGEKEYICICNDRYKEEIPAIGHTEVLSGTENEHSICEVCNAIISTEHEIIETITTSATCTESGEKICICECGYVYTQPISALGHRYNEIVTNSATCTESGEKTYICECGDNYKEEIFATGHIKLNGTVNVTTCAGCNEKMIDINANVFKDRAFRGYISQTYDLNGDGVLIGDEITSITSIDISGTEGMDGGYADLTGIEHFTELTELICDYNSGITSVDLSQNKKLRKLSMTGCTQITSIDVSGCTAINELDLSEYTLLTNLNVSGTAINNLDVAANTSLVTLVAKNCISLLLVNSSMNTQNLNALANVDFTGCINMTELNLNNCSNIRSVDVSTLTALETLNLSGTSINTFSGRTDLIDLSRNTNLISFKISYTNIGAIDVSNNPSLEVFVGSYITNLTELDFTNNPNLRALTLSNDSSLENLNINGCTQLQTLIVVDSSLTSIELIGYSNIRTLNIYDNMRLSSYTLSGCSSLTSLNLRGNTALETLAVSDCGIRMFTNLTQCTELTTLNINNCSSLTTLDISTLSNIEILNVDNCNGLTSLNVSECSMLANIGLNNTDNITTFNVTNAGSSVVGNLELITTNSNTYDILNIVGWDSSYMIITPSS